MEGYGDRLRMCELCERVKGESQHEVEAFTRAPQMRINVCRHVHGDLLFPQLKTLHRMARNNQPMKRSSGEPLLVEGGDELPATAKGILYALGTNLGEEDYINPAHPLRGLVKVSASSLLEDGRYDITNHPPSKTKYLETDEGIGEWICIELLHHEMNIQEFTFSFPHFENCDHIPKSFNLEGSGDGKYWRTLSSHPKDHGLIDMPHVSKWKVTNLSFADTFVRYARFVLTGETSSKSRFFVCSGVEFFGYVRASITRCVDRRPETMPRREEATEVLDRILNRSPRISDSFQRRVKASTPSGRKEIDQVGADTAARPLPEGDTKSNTSDERVVQPRVKSITLLVTTFASGSASQLTNCDRTRNIFEVKSLPVEVLDGSDPLVKDRRDKLFEISGKRGNYPQIFITREDESTEYLGGFEYLQSLVDNDDLPHRIRKAHPDILSFEDLFEHLRDDRVMAHLGQLY